MKKIILLFILLGIFSSAHSQFHLEQELARMQKNNQFEEALKIVDSLIKEDPYQARYYHDKVACQAMLKDYDGILLTFDDAIKIMPDSVSLYIGRGTLLDAFQMFDKALIDYDKAFELEKDSFIISNILSNRGGTKSKIRDFEGAYEDLVIAVSYDPTNLDALNNLAAACDEVGKADEGIKYLKQIIAVNPEYIPAFVNLGFKYQLRDEHEKAITYFDRAVELAPNEALGYSNRGFSKYKLGQWIEATNDVNKSIKLFPTNSYAFKIRALIHIENDRIDLACKDLETAIQLGYTPRYGEEVNELISKHCK